MNDINPSRIRWRGALIITTLAAGIAAAIWSGGSSQQDRVLRTAILVIAAGLLYFLWALFFARFGKRTRLLILLGGAGAAGFLASSVRLAGFSGDMVPILRFRWTKAPEIGGGAKVSESLKPRISSASYPQFLGPNRNGIITGFALGTNWVERPPAEVWRREVGAGWTGFAVSKGVAITQEQRGQNEFVAAYDLGTGAPIWSHADAGRYFTALGGEGPRANPTIEGDRVFTLGGSGILNCLELATGKLLWTKNLLEEHSTKVPEWGFAGAPLALNGLVIVNTSAGSNRTLAAHDAGTGAFAWGGGNDSAGYSSPALLTFDGVPQVVLFAQEHVVGHDPSNGQVLWSHPWPSGHPHVAMPIQISTNQLLVSSGYGYGSELIEVARATNGWSAERVWKSNRLKSKFANLILFRNYVYGLDDGILACLDPATGERKWHGERYGHGQLLLIGEILLLMAENGEILLVEPSPTEERVIARHKVLKGKTWNPPAFAAPYLLVRNDREAACFTLPTRH